MRQSYMILDGQWGSSGKGLLAGFLAKQKHPDVIVNNFGPNAGHTVVMNKGGTEKKVMTQQLPSGIVSRSAHTILLGPGAVINADILLKEIKEYGGYLQSTDVLIHPNASVVTQFDLDAEADPGGVIKISSTRKGVGAALASKVMRVPKPDGHPTTAGQHRQLTKMLVSDKNYRQILASAKMLQIESAQGVELSLNHGLAYPYCTSRDVTVEAILNDVGIRRDLLSRVYVTLRTYPIRVGNDYKNGVEVGNSGPVYPDMDELSWEQMSAMVGIPLEERTTVTNKVRRIFTWSDVQFKRMLDIIGPSTLFINFMNYLDATAANLKDANTSAKRFVAHVDRMARTHDFEDSGMFSQNECYVGFLGWGPAIESVEEVEQ